MRLALLFFALALALSACKQPSDFMLGGIQVNEGDQNKWVSKLKENDFNTVEVTTYAMQGDWDSSDIWWYDKDTSILQEVRAAKKQGLKVVLILRVAIDHSFEKNKFLWHGMIMPKNRSNMQEWFRRYRMFSQMWAKIATREGIDVLGIGSELKMLTWTKVGDAIPNLPEYYLQEEKQQKEIEDLLEFEDEIETRHLWLRGNYSYNSMEAYLRDRLSTWQQWAKQITFNQNLDSINARAAYLETEWRKVIKEIRQHFDGELTYAANFDNYQNVAFWDELDIMGVNAYFSLRDHFNDSLDRGIQMLNSWCRHLGIMDSFRQAVDSTLPVVFTELGYTNHQNSTVHPWASDGFEIFKNGDEKQLLIWKDFETDQNERALAVKYLKQAIKETALPLQGILYWKLTSKVDLLQVEPFGLLVGGNDPLEKELKQFLK